MSLFGGCFFLVGVNKGQIERFGLQGGGWCGGGWVVAGGWKN